VIRLLRPAEALHPIGLKTPAFPSPILAYMNAKTIRHRLHLLIGAGLAATTLVVWTCGDSRAWVLYPLFVIVAGLCYE
jgi:hypothetical protein